MSYFERRHLGASEISARAETPRRFRVWALLGAGVIVAVVGWGVDSRRSGVAELRKQAQEAARPTVELCAPTISSAVQELILPANIEAFANAPIYARVNGYLKSWTHDIGTSVKAGEVLAVIEAPDLDEQVEQAKSVLARSKVEEDLARTTARRWSSLHEKAAVSTQSVDEKKGGLEAATASLSAAKADFERLATMKSFLKLTAPFDGVITSRNVDIGALVDAGAGQGELFHVADIHKMRVYVRVPQFHAAKIKVGVTARLTLPQYPNREFSAELVATSNAITASSRTLLAQFQADNADGALLPGAFGKIKIELPAEGAPLSVPASALVFVNSSPQVATVDEGGMIHMKTVKIARDLGSSLEISAGLSIADRVVKTPWQSIHDGVVVKIKDAGGEIRKADAR